MVVPVLYAFCCAPPLALTPQCAPGDPIKISDLVAEFGGSAPHALSEYYRNGGEVPGNNTNVPTSGQISLTKFYSAVNEIQQTYSSTQTNLNLSTVFGSNWTTTVPKRVIINSGVTIGATSGNAAILIPSGMAGTLMVEISVMADLQKYRFRKCNGFTLPHRRYCYY